MSSPGRFGWRLANCPSWIGRVVAVTLLAVTARAGADPPRKPGAAGKTVVRFGEDAIDGDLLRPDGDLVSARPEIPMPNLVEPPRSFERAARRTILEAAAGLSRTAPAARSDALKAAGGSDAGGRDRSSGSAR